MLVLGVLCLRRVPCGVSFTSSFGDVCGCFLVGVDACVPDGPGLVSSMVSVRSLRSRSIPVPFPVRSFLGLGPFNTVPILCASVVPVSSVGVVAWVGCSCLPDVVGVCDIDRSFGVCS